MRILLDENIDYSVLALLRSPACDVLHVRDTPVRGRPDEEVLALAAREGRVLVTLDADFADIRRFPPWNTAGIVRIKLKAVRGTVLQRVLPRLLAKLSNLDITRCLVVATESSFRIRRGGP